MSKFFALLVIFFGLIFWFACYMGGLTLADVLQSVQTLARDLDAFIVSYVADVVATISK